MSVREQALQLLAGWASSSKGWYRGATRELYCADRPLRPNQITYTNMKMVDTVAGSAVCLLKRDNAMPPASP